MTKPAVTFPLPFPAWRYRLDVHLFEWTGRVFGDLPIPEAVAWEWYARGWAAHDVAERLIERAVKLPKTTVCREFGDNPWRKMQ